MIFLDTNILYYAAGKSTIQNVDIDMLNQIIKDEEICVSNITIFEMINKYKNKPMDVRDIASFLFDNNIAVLNSAYMISSCLIPEKLRSIAQNDLDNLYDNVIKVKIDHEASFTATIAILVIIIYFEFYLHHEIDDSFLGYYDFLTNYVDVEMKPYALQYFHQEYQAGYNTKDCEAYIKRSFYCFLSFHIERLSKPILKLAVCKAEEERKEILETLIDDDFYPIDINRKINKSVTSAKYIEKYIRQCGKSLPQSFFEDLEKKFNDKPGAFKFMISIAKDTITQGCSFRKNDISDRLILEQVATDDVILTFDNKMIAYIRNQSNHNLAYLHSINLVDKITKQ